MKSIKLTILTLVLSVAGLSQAQLFYKIEGNNLEKPSYIFGTHHLAPLSVVEDNNVIPIFEEVDQVVGEIDLTQDPMAIGMTMQSHMLAPADSTLSKIISPEDYEIINEEFKKLSIIPGADLSMFDMMKPMVVSSLVAVTIMSRQIEGYDPQNQLDTYFLMKAKEDGKTIVPLETPEFQASVLYDSEPLAYQAEGLVEMLKEPSKVIDSGQKLNKAYFEGDLDEMYALSEQDDEHPEFMAALLERRNADWLTKLPGIMNEAPTFIAVGALHLAGEKGLLEGLRQLGYTVTPAN